MARRRRDQGLGTSSCRRTGRKERPVQRNAANARERARMRVLSKAFSRLKTSLPWVPADTKLSKLDTLRLASSYISHLRKVLAEDDSQPGAYHPINFTWPFTFGSGRSADPLSPAEDGEDDGDESVSSHSAINDVTFDPTSEILRMNNHYADMAHSYDEFARVNAYNTPVHRNNIDNLSY